MGLPFRSPHRAQSTLRLQRPEPAAQSESPMLISLSLDDQRVHTAAKNHKTNT